MRGPARVTLLPDPFSAPTTADGPVTTTQEAEIELPAAALRELWHARNLERLARAYWVYLTRATLRLVRVVYAPDSRAVVLLSRRLALLRFRRPEYVTAPGLGQVTWRIERGFLVAPSGRGRGHLRIRVRRMGSGEEPGTERVRVTAEVANFYPLLRGSGPFARFGTALYNATQLRIHVWVTHGFLRSLERLELPPVRIGDAVGELRAQPGRRP